MSVNAGTGLFMSTAATATVQGLAGMIINGPGGMNLNTAKTTFTTGDFDVISGKTDFKTADYNVNAAKTSFKTADFDVTSAQTNIKTANLDVDSAKVDVTGSLDVAIKGLNVRLTGQLIYLN